MTPEEVIAQVKKRAKNNFKTGLNCAESRSLRRSCLNWIPACPMKPCAS